MWCSQLIAVLRHAPTNTPEEVSLFASAQLHQFRGLVQTAISCCTSLQQYFTAAVLHTMLWCYRCAFWGQASGASALGTILEEAPECWPLRSLHSSSSKASHQGLGNPCNGSSSYCHHHWCVGSFSLIVAAVTPVWRNCSMAMSAAVVAGGFWVSGRIISPSLPLQPLLITRVPEFQLTPLDVLLEQGWAK